MKRLVTISESLKIKNKQQLIKINEANESRFDVLLTPVNCDIDTGDVMEIHRGDTGSLSAGYNEGKLYTKKEADEEIAKMEKGDDSGYNWLSDSVYDVDGDSAEIKITIVEMKEIKTKTIKVEIESEDSGNKGSNHSPLDELVEIVKSSLSSKKSITKKTIADFTNSYNDEFGADVVKQAIKQLEKELLK